jgi:hypothetical protein
LPAARFSRIAILCPIGAAEEISVTHFDPKVFVVFFLAQMWAMGSVLPTEAQLETRTSTYVHTISGDAALAVADFNHDGNLDVAATGANLQIFLGNGDGTFQSPITYNLERSPDSIVVADFNGDGELDLAVTNYLSASVSVLFGIGDGTFRLEETLKTSRFPSWLEVGDFNNDHKPDLVLLNDNDIILFLNEGDGTFLNPIHTGLGKIGLDGIAVGDFDRNGTLDLAVAVNTLTSGGIVILSGNGDGTFVDKGRYSSFPNGQSIAVGDFRGDGRLDLVVPDFLGISVGVFLGNGDGTFQPAVNYLSSFGNWVTAADFNGDGKADIIISNQSNNGFSGGSVSVLLGNGDGTFQPQMVFQAGSLSNFVAVGDFNGDGKLDAISMDRWKDYMVTLLNTGVVVFSPASPMKFATRILGVAGPPLDIRLTNSGVNPITIESVSCSGSPFRIVSSTCAGSLTSGSHCVITTGFTPQTKGRVEGTVTIQDSASSKPQVIELFGTGTVVNFSPSSLTFPPQKVGTTSQPQKIQLTNTGSDALHFINSIYVAGKNYEAFKEDDNCGTQIASGASCTITIEFSPLKSGPRHAYINIQDDGGGAPIGPLLSGTAN